MRWRPVVAGLLAASLLAPSAHAEEISDQTLDWYVRSATNEIPAMGRSFGWAEPIEWSEGDALDTNAARISLNRAEIKALVSQVSGLWQQQAVRMIVAHETWHYVEYKRGTAGAPGSGSAERRLGECRADIMAARYLASVETGPWTYGLLQTPQRETASELWRVDSADHPTPLQRTLAAHLGALSVHRTKPDLPSAERRELDLLLGIAADEDPAVWGQRICLQVVHAQDAAMRSIIISEPEARTSEGRTTVRVGYSNRSSRRIEVTTTVSGRQFPQALDGTGQTHHWIFPLTITLEPGEADHWIERELPGAAPTSPGDPTIFFDARVGDPNALIAARVLPGAPTQGPWAIAGGLSAADTTFALALQALANGALNGFADFRGAGVVRGAGTGSLSFPSTIRIPGSDVTTISLDNRGAAGVSAFFSSGRSAEAARAAFDEARARLRRIWPAASWQDLGPDHFTISISRYCNAELQILGEGQYAFASLNLWPNALGLVE